MHTITIEQRGHEFKWNMERYMEGLRGKKGKEKCYNLKLNDSFKSKPKEKNLCMHSKCSRSSLGLLKMEKRHILKHRVMRRVLNIIATRSLKVHLLGIVDIVTMKV